MSQVSYEQVSALMDHVDEMTPWEYDFVMHMADFEEKGNLFSPERQATIDKLHMKYCNTPP